MALEACERDWLATARDLHRAALCAARTSADPAQRRKAVDFLLRRGFDQRTALASACTPRDDDGADSPNSQPRPIDRWPGLLI